MKIEKVDINSLISPEFNPRTITDENLQKLQDSIDNFGYIEPIIVNDVNNHIVGGNQRWKALKQLGYETVDVIYVHYTDLNKEKACNLALNKISGEWDTEKVKIILQEIELSDIDIGLTGFNDLELKELEIKDNPVDEIVEDNFEENIDEIETDIKLGDKFQLGNHILLCGDATNPKDVDDLIGGGSIDMIFTDPPYNVQFNGRSGKFDIIENDNLSDAEFEKFIDATAKIIQKIKPQVYYIWCNWKFYGTLQEKLPYKNCIVWAKNVFGLGKGYRHQHEFCLFNGDVDKEITNETDLWEIKKDSNYIHPTQKPVELCARALKNHKNVTTVLDLFGGSGSTLIACEQTHRRCYLMEIDPKYCQTIINRYEEFTGNKTIKIK